MRTFCIVCREMPDRMAAGLDHVHGVGLNVEPFYGIHAKSFGILPGISYQQANKFGPTTIGHLGCTISHYLLWRVLEYLSDDMFLVLEDDVILTPDFPARLADVCLHLPRDWHFIQLGHLGGGVVNTLVNGFGKPSKYHGGTHCYLVSRSGVSRLLELTKNVRRPIDAQLAEDCWPFMNFYCVIESLAGQRTVAGEWPRSTLEN